MIEILPNPKENIVALKVSGKLTKADYDHLAPTLESRIRQFGKIKLYCEIENLGMPTLHALWEEIKMDLKHYTDFSQIAMIGDQEWLKAITKLIAPMVPGEIRIYNEEDKETAMNWLST